MTAAEGSIVLSTEKEVTMLRAITRSEGLSEFEFEQFLMTARVRRLNPLIGQLMAHKRDGRLTMVVSIDAMREKAQEDPRFRGYTATQWLDEDGVWHDAWRFKTAPVAARVGVYMRDFPEPVWGIATRSEYFGRGPWWKKGGGAHMLAKCAEALALRRACPAALGGTYTREEMDQVVDPSEPVVSARVEKGPEPTPVPTPEPEEEPEPEERPWAKHVKPEAAALDAEVVQESKPDKQDAWGDEPPVMINPAAMSTSELRAEYSFHKSRLGSEAFKMVIAGQPLDSHQQRGAVLMRLRSTQASPEALGV